MAKTVKLYGNASCPYCGAARMLLTKKGIQFEDIPVMKGTDLYEQMAEASGRRSVPQIFIDDVSIGGFDELYELDKRGELDALVAGDQSTLAG